MKELHTPQIREFTEKYRRNWKEHVGRMSADRILKKIFKEHPKGKRNLGRPLKQWKDSDAMPVTGLKKPNIGKDDDDVIIDSVKLE
jgi:hypothetical protein